MPRPATLVPRDSVLGTGRSGLRRLLLGLLLVGLGLAGVWAAMAPRRMPLPRGYGVAVGWERGVAALDRFGPVWYYDFTAEGADRPGHARLLMIRPWDAPANLGPLVAAHPGHWWVVGNEPNDPHQDNQTPAAYARYFVRTAMRIRAADPTAGIIVAGLADADTAWADRFLAAYRQISPKRSDIDAWNIHNYLLDGPSQYDQGRFKNRIIDFRKWMAAAGERDKPLLLTEFGVLYGAGCCDRPRDVPERGHDFMRGVLAWLETTRLVDAWSWFTLDSGDQQFNGDLLYAPGSTGLSLFGQIYAGRARAFVPAAR